MFRNPDPGLGQTRKIWHDKPVNGIPSPPLFIIVSQTTIQRYFVIFQVSIKAAEGEGVAVTGVMLWDGPIDGIATYDYITEEDWTKNICDCCLEDPIPEVDTDCK